MSPSGPGVSCSTQSDAVELRHAAERHVRHPDVIVGADRDRVDVPPRRKPPRGQLHAHRVLRPLAARRTELEYGAVRGLHAHVGEPQVALAVRVDRAHGIEDQRRVGGVVGVPHRAGARGRRVEAGEPGVAGQPDDPVGRELDVRQVRRRDGMIDARPHEPLAGVEPTARESPVRQLAGRKHGQTRLAPERPARADPQVALPIESHQPDFLAGNARSAGPDVCPLGLGRGATSSAPGKVSNPNKTYTAAGLCTWILLLARVGGRSWLPTTNARNRRESGHSQARCQPDRPESVVRQLWQRARNRSRVRLRTPRKNWHSARQLGAVGLCRRCVALALVERDESFESSHGPGAPRPAPAQQTLVPIDQQGLGFAPPCRALAPGRRRAGSRASAMRQWPAGSAFVRIARPWRRSSSASSPGSAAERIEPSVTREAPRSGWSGRNAFRRISRPSRARDSRPGEVPLGEGQLRQVRQTSTAQRGCSSPKTFRWMRSASS